MITSGLTLDRVASVRRAVVDVPLSFFVVRRRNGLRNVVTKEAHELFSIIILLGGIMDAVNIPVWARAVLGIPFLQAFRTSVNNRVIDGFREVRMSSVRRT